MLTCDKNMFLPNGALTLLFECRLSSPFVEFSRVGDSPANQGTDSAAQASTSTQPIDQYPKRRDASVPDTLSRDLLKLYENGVLSDFNLKVGDVTFPVHRQLLSARSPKFGAMFTTNRKRKRGGTGLDTVCTVCLLRN